VVIDEIELTKALMSVYTGAVYFNQGDEYRLVEQRVIGKTITITRVHNVTRLLSDEN
jgi:hypothetical protein